jgi:hypothetical protein
MYLDFDWKVLDDQYGSDHFSLLLKSNNSITYERRQIFKFRKADWETFSKLCSIDLTKNEFNFTSADIAETFSSALHTIACKVISLTNNNKSNKIKKHGLTMKVKKPFVYLNLHLKGLNIALQQKTLKIIEYLEPKLEDKFVNLNANDGNHMFQILIQILLLGKSGMQYEK